MFEFIESLAEDTWVVTPNKRLSQNLQKIWADRQAATVLREVPFLPYSQLINRLYQSLRQQLHQSDHPQPLNNFQFYALVSKVVEQQDPQLYNPNLVQKIIEAWRHCQNWGVDLDEQPFSLTPQTRLYYQWCQGIEKELAALAGISDAQLPAYLLQQPLTPPFKSLIWYGFDDKTPQQIQVMEWLGRAGVNNRSADMSTAPAPRVLFKACDEQEEQEQWLAWLKNRENPQTQLAVVIPDLPNRANSLSRLMHRHFPTECFNISLGKPLLDYSLAGHALCLLQLRRNGVLSKQQIHLLLHSPFIGGAGSEMQQRCALLESENMMRHRQMKLGHFIKICHQHAPLLAQQLSDLNDFPEQASPCQWAHYFDQRLAALGFPGDLALSSDCYQTYQRFSNALNDLRSLNFIDTHYTHEQAVESFRQVLQQIIFQPQASPHARIHLYGLLEAEGIPFDGIWISGLCDTVLPQAVHYSPFIPIPLQQQYQMPHASMDRELKLAGIILDRFHKASPEVICSYPASSGDRPNLVSPMLGDADTFSPLTLPEPPRLPLERRDEIYHIPLDANERLRGGSAVLANQAKCPFKAFANYRLHCDKLVEQQEAVESRDQGNLIHRVMELIWQTLRNQERLLACSVEDRMQLIHKSCDQALREFLAKNASPETDFSLKIERDRLMQLAQACLEVDEQRPPFTVTGLESVNHYRIGSHQLKLKIDRLDEDEAGNKWLIDYKSTIPSPLPWNQERPEEPQLLLYALLDESIQTLTYLQLKTVSVRYKGLSANTSPIAGVNPLKKQSWEQGRQQWQSAIDTLKDEFEQGYCPPQPVKKQICDQCEYSGLCRFTMQQGED